MNTQGYGICSKAMLLMFPIMEAVRSGGIPERIGGSGPYTKDAVCPDGNVIFRLKAARTGTKTSSEEFLTSLSPAAETRKKPAVCPKSIGHAAGSVYPLIRSRRDSHHSTTLNFST